MTGEPGDGGRGTALGAGLRLAVTTLTVLPIRGGRVDRAAAAVARRAGRADPLIAAVDFRKKISAARKERVRRPFAL